MPNLENKNYKMRIQSIDLLRGVVILLMALDHVRDFFGAFPYNAQDLAHVSPLLFMTRWITNLCAPTFMFLSGMSAYLYSQKVSRNELSSFLLKRGFILVFLEITFVTCSWTFEFYPEMILQVIWALGLSMIVMSALIWLPRKIILLLSIIVIFGHNLFDQFILDETSGLGMLWHMLHISFDLPINNLTISFSYPLLPWPAVMALGYCLGHWMQEPVAIRNKKFMLLGASLLSLFVVLRFVNGYGDSYHWESQANGIIYTALSFIKVSKYPPSLFYVLINLGIIMVLWPLWENWKGFGSQFVLCFGKVAMFFYLIHLPLIHILANIHSHIMYHVPGGWWWHQHGVLHYPEQYHFSLGLVYTVWVFVILAMYPLCLWYKKYKATHQYQWLKYI
jgi:uncharacterized membrane protein